MTKNNCVTRNQYIYIINGCINNQSFIDNVEKINYDILYELWAAIVTKPFNTWYGVSSTSAGITHIFNVRYFYDLFNQLDTNLTVLYNNTSFNILGIDNKDCKDKNIYIYCNIQGNINIQDIQYNANN